MQALRQLTGMQSVALISLKEFEGLSLRHVQHSGQRRNFQLFEEDLQRGAFDDFKELKDTGGKLWHASFKLLPQSAAKPFPSIQVSPAIGGKAHFPPEKDMAPDVTLVCAGFRAGSEAMLASWSRPFLHKFGKSASHNGSARLIELSIVESRVMSVWPFRSMVMRAAKSAAAAEANTAQVSPPEQPVTTSIPDCVASGVAHDAHQAPNAQQAKQHDANPTAAGAQRGAGTGSDPKQQSIQQPQGSLAVSTALIRFSRQDLFFFGDPYDLSKALGITNRLTGYIFLVDRYARVRFRGCGHATPSEAAALLLAAEQLVVKRKSLT